MEKMTLKQIADLCGGSIISGDSSVEIHGVSTDSRTIRKGELFLALRGDHFDGIDFAGDVARKGGVGIVGEGPKLPHLSSRLNESIGLIETGDTLAALHLLARRYRSKFTIPVVGVTGSCGKTTTKDMLAAILSQSRKTVKTEGNLNNLIGAPLMLLRIDSTTRAAVIEIASNAPGEIARLSQILNPTAGIITNIGPVHLEGLRSIEGVLSEKCSLSANVSPEGFVAINEEDIPAERIRSLFGGKIVTFGLNDSADFYATDIRQDVKTGADFLLNDKDHFHIPVPGLHNVLNALAAIAAASELGIGTGEIRRGLGRLAAGKMRMEMCRFRGATIVNDAYNANPRAMRESISTIMAMPAKRRILALGDMLELGDYAREAHRSLGNYIGQNDPELIYLRGEYAADVREGALEGGIQPERIYCCADAQEIATSLRYILQPGDMLLVKGSRGMQMERVVQLLLQEE